MSQTIQIKGGICSVINLTVTCWDENQIVTKLQSIAREAPQLVSGMPMVIVLEDAAASDCTVDKLRHLLEQISSIGAAPFLLKSRIDLRTICAQNKISYIELTESELSRRELQKGRDSSHVEASPLSQYLKPMVVTDTIRSGQQVYARNSDLIVMANVNRGAEIMADGSIIVAGALNGRALAGMQGVDDAFITAGSLNSELVAINGHYILRDDFPADLDEHRHAIVSVNGRTARLEVKNLSI